MMNQILKQLLFFGLPQEITNQILEFDGRFSIRGGKPIMKISPDDERYELLEKMPKIRENTIYQYESHYGCKTIVWFKCGGQLMYCNDQWSRTVPNHSYVFRLRRRRAHPDEHKWKIPEITKIL